MNGLLTKLLYFGKLFYMQSTTKWADKRNQRLAQVLADTSDSSDIKAFLGDVMTQREINEIAARLEAAKMLTDGRKYTEIIAATGLSGRTIARIRDWIQNGNGGYKNTFMHHAHLWPDRAR